ncbi:hypothetical protein [uncultured Moraxella sp.]|uniref:hypothetical protein n=1 Tax=uncultured Moraxella sp. TaxID=263769 RepID=UPI0025E88899|nr:hypothetical protein [uncultured Moraxella sp.]
MPAPPAIMLLVALWQAWAVVIQMADLWRFILFDKCFFNFPFPYYIYLKYY